MNPTQVVDFEGSNLAIDTAGHLGVSPEIEARVAELEARLDESEAIHQTLIDIIETNARTVNSIASTLETSFNDRIFPTIENGFNTMTDTVVTFINETLIDEFIVGTVIEKIITEIELTVRDQAEGIEGFHAVIIQYAEAFSLLSTIVEGAFNIVSNTVEDGINRLSDHAKPDGPFGKNYLIGPISLPTISLPRVPVPDPLELEEFEIDRPTPPVLGEVPDLSLPRLSLPRVNEEVLLSEP